MAAFDDWDAYHIPPIIIGGFLVGVGTQLGSGCTAGHGICGMALMRNRSIFATFTFIVFGMITAMSTNVYAGFPEWHNTLRKTPCGWLFAICLVGVIVINVFARFCMYTEAGALSEGHATHVLAFRTISEFLLGLAFAIGLVITNMTEPSAVMAFLDLRYWNPALLFLMGAAILIAGISFHITNGYGRPLLDFQLHVPAAKDLDGKLIFGAMLFGVGWGLCGICPAPALVNLGSSVAGYKPFAWVGMAILGQWCAFYATPCLFGEDVKEEPAVASKLAKGGQTGIEVMRSKMGSGQV